MKTIISVLLALFILIPSHGFGEPVKNSLPPNDSVELPDAQQTTANAIEVNEKYLVEQRVMSLPGRHAKTVDLYISKMAAIPGASDLGWQVQRVEGGYEVIREIQKDLKVFSFKWRVNDSGEITPINKRAKDIMKKPDPVSEKPTN
jgi:hypothetical protein